MKEILTEENYQEKAYEFRDRQAGVSIIFDPKSESYTYNAYCLEKKLMKELFSVEHDYLQDALDQINQEFGTWDLTDLGEKSGCGSWSWRSGAIQGCGARCLPGAMAHTRSRWSARVSCASWMTSFGHVSLRSKIWPCASMRR